MKWMGLTAALIISACSTGPGATPTPASWAQQGNGDLVPIVVSTELAIGPNRFLLHLVDRANEPLASPDRKVTFNFYNLATSTTTPTVTVAAIYMHILDRLPGLYRAPVEFPAAGSWGLEVVTNEADGSHRSGRLIFPVHETSSTPAIGAGAPPSHTPTAATDAEIKAISTDTAPDPDFYRLSVDQALADHKPFLLIFATPAFCKSATCGPALDVVKSVAPEFKDKIAFIHVEPYELEESGGQLQPVFDANNQPIPVASVNEWGLTTEPYVFVVDSAGKVRAKLEGIAAPDELRGALTAVAAGQ